MPLNGYIEVPGTATVGGAPIDAFQADAFRQNDGLYEKLLRSILSTPVITNDGSDGPRNHGAGIVQDPVKILRATTIDISDPLNSTSRVPLIWLASEKIKIDHGGANTGEISAVGKGAQPGEVGDFGGSGGGGATAGQPCKLPISGHQILAGGAASSGGNDLPDIWPIRALSILMFCRGGAAGGDDGAANKGGAGGGVVVLCAPEIEIVGAGKIDARGADGSGGNAGGGGGGLIVLLAREKTNVHTSGANQNLHVDGGAGQGTGGAGGKGQVLELPFP